MTSTENYPGEPGLGFVEETSGSEAGERRPRETRPDRVTASAGDRQIGVGRLQPDRVDLDEPLPVGHGVVRLGRCRRGRAARLRPAIGLRSI